MKISQFLDHHGLTQNPFAQEDAQSDPLFKDRCSKEIFHPAWEKVFGVPSEPATSVVFGEKGSGKTAIRLQIVGQIEEYNTKNPQAKVFVIEYDDFNPFLDCFHQKMGASKKPEKTLPHWRLWDHMDAILSLGVSHLIDEVLSQGPFSNSKPFDASRLSGLTRPQKRDLLLLAAYYDHSTGLTQEDRWTRLRRKLRFMNIAAYWDMAIAVAAPPVLIGLLAYFNKLEMLQSYWVWLVLLAFCVPWIWRQLRLMWHAWFVTRQVRVRELQANVLRGLLAKFCTSDLIGQPAPSRDRSDDRYEMLAKFQAVLRVLGYQSIVVLVDRVDEPYLINGSSERMRDLMWPMFDNKFLKHAGLGFKLLLPQELSHFVDRADKEFYERARLDKQNLIRSLEWSGESLYDLANDRIRASAKDGSEPKLRDWFDGSIQESELINTLSRLRVPRHLFKFMHRLLTEHCLRSTEESPQWKISRETLHTVTGLYLRDLDAYDRGQGTS